MIKASEARKLANKTELEQIEKDLAWLDRQIRTTALDNYDTYDFCVNHLSKSGREIIKANLEDAGYKVSFMTGIITNDAYYRIEW